MWSVTVAIRRFGSTPPPAARSHMVERPRMAGKRCALVVDVTIRPPLYRRSSLAVRRRRGRPGDSRVSLHEHGSRPVPRSIARARGRRRRRHDGRVLPAGHVRAGHATWSAAARSRCPPARGPTTRRWRCAWPRAWSSGACSIRSTSSSATCAGTARGTGRAPAAASTSATPPARRSSASSARASRIPATPRRTPPATAR